VYGRVTDLLPFFPSRMKYISLTSANPPSLLRKAGAIVATTALAGVALMFSAVLLALLLGIAAVAWTYLWWKTRELRKQMRDFPRNAPMEQDMFKGEVIEGEAIRVDTSADRIRH